MDRRDITAQAVEFSVGDNLSSDINQLAAEIQGYQVVGGQAIFEIGRRLQWVKENDLTHGQFIPWLKKMGMERTFAKRAMKIAREFSDSKGAALNHLGVSILYELATLPEEEREAEHVTKGGAMKKPEEMSWRELQDLKKQLKQAHQDNEELHNKVQRLQNQPVKEVTKTVEVAPEDYHQLKHDNEALNQTLSQLQSQLTMQRHVSEGMHEELERLGNLELEGQKEQQRFRELKAKTEQLDEKIEWQTSQLARVKELSSFCKQANELLDDLGIIVGRLDTTIIPEGAPVLLSLTEIADKCSDFGGNLRQQLDQPMHL
ncbi:hypothetical protein [uncultured Secundilactobacillus sp.]|uniref:hypothetical protein n=1 Tax=uncultured Secundilactobacillus sp. TaxID=2813935 RepID=UPI0025891CE1|nr:hypothetical protein [uncultured Secundilactobacillus sp.]